MTTLDEPAADITAPAAIDVVRGTAERILDAAEDLFAERGYSATTLGEVAERVGIRSPSLYNHYRNKQALYNAVLERLLGDFAQPMEELRGAAVTRQRVLQWLEVIVRKHHANPNLARLLQHAALSGDPVGNAVLVERFFAPMFDPSQQTQGQGISVLGDEGLQPWAVMAFNNLVMSYVTMAPMYRDLLGQDPYSEAALETQLRLVKTLALAAFEYQSPDSKG